MRRALLLMLACGACAPQRPDSSSERLQTLEGLELRQSEGGKPSWTLKARLAVLREDQKKAVLVEPSMEFLRGSQPVSRVTALEGEVATDTRDVRLSRAVTLDSFEDKSRLDTEELTYSAARRLFRTDREVLVRRPEGTLRGKGLEATPDLSEIRVFNQRTVVRGRPR